MNNRIIGCISIFAGLGLVYLFKNRLEKRSDCLSRELTLKIAQEIKYHMIVLCIDFARKVDKQLKKALKPAQIDKTNHKLKQSMHEFYSQKEQLILGKYQVENQLYKQSLMHFEKDAYLLRIRKEIVLMMEDAIEGDGPSLAVHQQASHHLNCYEAIEVFRQLQLNIVLLVWKQVINFTQNDPTFNPKDELHFKKVLQKLKIYDAKIEFLVQKGYLKEWGCPNEIFLKMIQNYKDNPDLNLKIKEIESTYGQTIDNIQDNPFYINEQGIKALFRKITFQEKQYN